jgi:2-polyprenyl-6-methoxyphenol 4-hydroxylase
MSQDESQAMLNKQTQHIAIVGGGMVGVSLAIMLAQACESSAQAMRISLIEKLPFPTPPPHTDQSDTHYQPSFDARSTALSAGSVALLNTIRVWSRLQHQAQAIQKIHISDKGHYSNTQLHADDHKLDALGYVVENRWLGHCLLARLQDTSVHCIAPATVSGCQIKKTGAVLSITQKDEQQHESEYELNADVVLIADGADSPLRQSLGIDSDTTPYHQSAIITNIALKQSHQGIAYERFTSQGPLAVLPLSHCDGLHRASVVWTRDTQQAKTVMALDDDAFIQQLQKCFGYRADYIQHVGQRHCYPLALVQAKEQVRSHIVVLGNAAHFLHPVAGQGFNLSLRDSAVLVDVLRQAMSEQQALGHYDVLQRYQQQREKDQQLTIGLTNAMVNTFSSTKMSVSVLRQMGLLSLNAIPSAKKILAKQMMGMSS